MRKVIVLVAAALAIAAVPFSYAWSANGSFTAHVTASGTFDLTNGALNATAVATHVGRLAVTGTVISTGPVLSCEVPNVAGTITATTPNGNTITEDLSGAVCPQPDGTFKTTGTFTVTGGTGRYTNASGGGTFIAITDYRTSAPGTITVTEDGTLNLG